MVRVGRIRVVAGLEGVRGFGETQRPIFFHDVDFGGEDVGIPIGGGEDLAAVLGLHESTRVAAFGESHRPTARVIRPGEVHRVQTALEAFSKNGDGFVVGIEFVCFAIAIHIGGVAGTIPNDPGLRGHHAFVGMAVLGEFVAHEVVVVPNPADQQAIHQSVAIQMVGDIEVQRVDAGHEFLVGGEAVVIIDKCHGAFAVQAVKNRTGFARRGAAG